MDVMQAIKTRKSVRNYKDKDIEEEKLNLVLEAARLAPSAKNFQEWKFIVVKDKKIRQKLMVAANNQTFVGTAPVIIVCCAHTNDDYKMRCGHPAYLIDVAIAIDHMTLKATEEGLGTCWIGSFYEDQVKEILGIPEHIRVVELLPIGYPDSSQEKKKQRVALKDIVYYERWG